MGALIWPMAAAEAQKYRKVMNTIDYVSENIDIAVLDDYVLSSDMYTYSTDILYGEYYDIYVGRVNDWTESAEKIRLGFAEFQKSRDQVYEEAKTQCGIWTSRIGLRHPDPPAYTKNKVSI